MIRKNVIELIISISDEKNAFDLLESALSDIAKDALSLCLLECGIIPEEFSPSSSEEKLWAKYCDILLAHTWSYIGIPSEVLRARGDSADVFGHIDGYSIVGDAKAFRLSRTAKNQKDFKISALDDWRKSNTFASLVSPYFQYPNTRSQIYQQAIQRNITLLSYIHLKFILDNFDNQDFTDLWNTAGNLAPTKSAPAYWGAIDNAVCSLVGQPADMLLEYRQVLAYKTKNLGQEGIIFWEARIEEYKQLTQQEAVKRLIHAEKIEAKIQTIRKAIDIRV